MFIILPYPELDVVDNPNARHDKSFGMVIGRKKKVRALLDKHKFTFDTSLPIIVTITRLCKQRLDDDNFAARTKLLRDWIAEQLVKDDQAIGLAFTYKQNLYGIKTMYTVAVQEATSEVIKDTLRRQKIGLYKQLGL